MHTLRRSARGLLVALAALALTGGAVLAARGLPSAATPGTQQAAAASGKTIPSIHAAGAATPNGTPETKETPEPADPPDAEDNGASNADRPHNHGWTVSQAANADTPAGFANHRGDFFGLGVFATEPDGEHRADIRMPRQRQHQADSVGIVVTTGETDNVRIFLVRRDGLGDVLRALDGINYQHQIAHALPAVGAQETGPGISEFGVRSSEFGVFRHTPGRCRTARRNAGRACWNAHPGRWRDCADAPTRRGKRVGWRGRCARRI